MKKSLSLACVASWSLVALKALAADAVATGMSPPFAVDTRPGEHRCVGDALVVGYASEWGSDAAGARVVLERVDHADMFNAVTSRVEIGDAPMGTVSVAAAAEAPLSVRLLHSVEVGGVRTGETLVADVAFGLRSGKGGAFTADSRAESLQECADAGLAAPVVYDTGWNAAASSLDLELDDGEAAVPLGSWTAPASGVKSVATARAGEWTLRCILRDAEGVALETLTAGFRARQRGMILLLK